MSILGLIAFALTIFLFSITPGPGVFALIASAMRYGFKSCIGLSLGMALMDCLYLIAVCYGLSAIIERWDVAFTLIKIFGAVYLFYVGYRLWNDEATFTLNNDVAAVLPKFSQGFLQGLVISGSNPKVMLFYISFLPSFIDISTLSNSNIMALVVICFLALNLGLLSISAAVSFSRRWFNNEHGARAINKGSAILLWLAASWLLFHIGN